MSFVLAVDLGGSSLKACLFEVGGAEVAAATVPLSFVEDATGRSEQDPELWWRALVGACDTIAAKAPKAFPMVAFVAICGFTRTQVLLDASGRVLRPAIGFRDTRAAASAEAALRLPGVAAHPAARHFNAFHPLARLLWLQGHEPKTFAAIRLVMEPKDYLNLCLTGEARSDRISQFWLAGASRGGGGSLTASCGIPDVPLPPIGNPEDEVGTVRKGLPGVLAQLAGAAVLCGSNDTFAAVAGLGALRAGCAYCISGSSEVFGLLADKQAEAEGLITIPWGDALWHLGGPGQNGANALAWIVDRLDRSDRPFAERLDGLLAQPASPHPLLCHPFLNGERTPFWDADLRASFLGLAADHGPGDLVRAVMEGVAFINRTVLERAEAATGHRAMEVRLGGGGARSAAWNQIRADILGRPVLASAEGEMGLLGCLALARFRLGLDATFGAGVEARLRLERFTPDPARRERADALNALFKESYGALAAASHRLAEIGRR
jgi:xylulokinase